MLSNERVEAVIEALRELRGVASAVAVDATRDAANVLEQVYKERNTAAADADLWRERAALHLLVAGAIAEAVRYLVPSPAVANHGAAPGPKRFYLECLHCGHTQYSRTQSFAPHECADAI